jgi:hypothetical protein
LMKLPIVCRIAPINVTNLNAATIW